MRFHHAPAIWEAHPTLVAGVISASGITANVDVQELIEPFRDSTLARLEQKPVSEFPEVRAWRQAFSAMGLKPTQYRCASEALLRRLHKDDSLPQIHPLVDLCNHLSASTAIPIAVFDTGRIDGDLTVRPADGTERYETFSGEVEHPAAGEVVFADDVGRAHARRWTNRQSATSAIRDTTREVLIVVEAFHDGADHDVPALLATLAAHLGDLWGGAPRSAMLTTQWPWFPAD